MHDKKARLKFIEKCYKLYEQKMYQIAYSVLRDCQMAEDAVQEAFLKLVKCNVYFEDAKSDDCKRYMITVIKHASINIYNKKQKEREIMYLSDREEMMQEQIAESSGSDSDNLEDIISNLPSKYYSVVKCLTIENLSVKETAVKLGITEANVRKRFERSKMMLKTILKGGTNYETDRKIYESRIS